MNMQLPSNMKDITPILAHLGHKRVAQIVTGLIVIYIAFLSAKITWSVIPNGQTSQSSLNSQSTNNYNGRKTNKTFDVSTIQALHLFGEYNKSEDEEGAEGEVNDEALSDVPETSLNLTLAGLVASNNKAIAAAIIENKGEQETYGIGDIIKGTRASLEQVLMDRVLIKHSGKLEALMLDGFDYNQPVKTVASKPAVKKGKARARQIPEGVVDQRKNKALTKNAKNARNELSSDPTKMSDYLRISPKRKGGDIIGYSLRPGKKPEFFELSGLKSGDVAVEMNGYDLTATTQAMQAMVEMKEARDISLLIDRQGSLTEILISLD